MTLDGAPVSWVTLFPFLLAIAEREPFYRRGVWPCRCTVGPCSADPGDADLPGGRWSCCPYGLLRGAAFSIVAQLDACAAVAPLAGWPDAYPAWLSWSLVTLHQRRRAKGAK